MPDLNPVDAANDIMLNLIMSGFAALAKLLWNVVVQDLLGTTFALLDYLGTPDLSSDGALLSGILPITVGLGIAVITIMVPIQIAKGVLHGGRGLLTPLVGAVQYAVISVSGLAVLALLIAASGALSNGILQSGLHVDSWQSLSTNNGPVQTLVAGLNPIVVILITIVLYFPLACLLGAEIGLRYVALLLLAATMPIWAAGAVADATRTWLWRGARWSLALVLMEPVIALVLVIAFRASAGAAGAFGAHAGAAASVVGFVMTALLLLVALACPLALFKLLAFIDPNTVSGVRVRNVVGGAGRRGGEASGAHGGRDGHGRGHHGAGGGGDPVEAASSGHAARSAGVFASMGRPGDLARKVHDGMWATAGAAAAAGSRDLDAVGAGHTGFVNGPPPRRRDGQPQGSASETPHRQGTAPAAAPSGPSRPGPGSTDPAGSPNAVGGPPGPAPLEGSAVPELGSAETVPGLVLSSSWSGGISEGARSAPSPAPSSPSTPVAQPAPSGSGGTGGWPARVSSPWSTPATPTGSSPATSGRSSAPGSGRGPGGLPGPRLGPGAGAPPPVTGGGMAADSAAGAEVGAGMGAGTAAGGAEALIGVEALGLVVLL